MSGALLKIGACRGINPKKAVTLSTAGRRLLRKLEEFKKHCVSRR